MDLVAALFLAGGNLVVILVFDNFSDTRPAFRTINRLEDIAWYDASLTIDLQVCFIHTVTGDAGNTFAGYLRAFPERSLAFFTHLGASLGVTTDTEISDRGSQIVDSLFKLVKHRRNRCIGMTRGAPLFVDFTMTLGAFCCRRVGTYRKDIGMGIGCFLFSCLNRPYGQCTQYQPSEKQAGP